MLLPMIMYHFHPPFSPTAQTVGAWLSCSRLGILFLSQSLRYPLLLAFPLGREAVRSLLGQAPSRNGLPILTCLLRLSLNITSSAMSSLILPGRLSPPPYVPHSVFFTNASVYLIFIHSDRLLSSSLNPELFKRATDLYVPFLTRTLICNSPSL